MYRFPFYPAFRHGGFWLCVGEVRFEGLSERVKRRLEGVYVLEGYAYSFEKGLYPSGSSTAAVEELEEQIL
ncbi:MAG: hypothetical protein NZ989_08790 [Bacteroidia bacterium]|nr:hypothetical protein [Bacteroidia bacterium]